MNFDQTIISNDSNDGIDNCDKHRTAIVSIKTDCCHSSHTSLAEFIQMYSQSKAIIRFQLFSVFGAMVTSFESLCMKRQLRQTKKCFTQTYD